MEPELASLTLFRATPAQVLESQKRTWPQWGVGLTEEKYLERDAQLDTMEHSVDSRWITWVLAPRDNPHTLDFMCACGTYKRRGLLRYSGSKEIQEVTCYGIATVFTPPHKRGKGYASHMMSLLHWVISGRTPEYNLPQFPAQWGVPPPEVVEAGTGKFSVLYSDVGDEFYRRASPGVGSVGWETRSPISTIWKIPQKAATDQQDRESVWTWLQHGDLDAFWERDVHFIRRTMGNLPESSSNYHIEKPAAFVSYLPDRGVGSFHIFRSMFGAESIISMDVWGVEKKKANVDQPTYATWSIDVRPLPPVLIVTRISATESEFPDLLRRIQGAARKSGIGKMEIWNIPPHLSRVAAETGGETFKREEHLSAIKWYGEGTTADIEWVLNEK